MDEIASAVFKTYVRCRGWRTGEMRWRRARQMGARNVFDEYPDEGEYRLRETSNGRIYRSDTIVDWQGGFYYLRTKYSF